MEFTTVSQTLSSQYSAHGQRANYKLDSEKENDYPALLFGIPLKRIHQVFWKLGPRPGTGFETRAHACRGIMMDKNVRNLGFLLCTDRDNFD